MRTPNKIVLGVVCASYLFANTETSRPGVQDGLDFKFSYGSFYLLPSLHANSNLVFDTKKKYPDLHMAGTMLIGSSLRYSGAVEVCNLPPEIIGTNYARTDYPLSTGRFQESKIDYCSTSLLISVGRANFFVDTFRSEVFRRPINGDGFSWEYRLKNWSFKHVIESLPAEKSGDIVFRRVLNYHHLSFHHKNTLLGLGEYFILTGTSIGLDLKRMNPFVPYSRNSHDSYRDIYPGYTLDSDSDNSIIKIFLSWASSKSELSANLYVDEFLVDSEERKTINDAILFNINYHQEFNSIPIFKVPWNIQGTFSISHPNFGQHPGPFTSATSAEYPLFEHSLGMLTLGYLKADIILSKQDYLSISTHKERWQDISSLSPDLRNKKDSLKEIPVKKDSRVMLVYEREIPMLLSKVSISTWKSSDPYGNGIRLSIRIQYPF